jgi:hypothetical protein
VTVVLMQPVAFQASLAHQVLCLVRVQPLQLLLQQGVLVAVWALHWLLWAWAQQVLEKVAATGEEAALTKLLVVR